MYSRSCATVFQLINKPKLNQERNECKQKNEFKEKPALPCDSAVEEDGHCSQGQPSPSSSSGSKDGLKVKLMGRKVKNDQKGQRNPTLAAFYEFLRNVGTFIWSITPFVIALMGLGKFAYNNQEVSICSLNEQDLPDVYRAQKAGLPRVHQTQSDVPSDKASVPFEILRMGAKATCYDKDNHSERKEERLIRMSMENLVIHSDCKKSTIKFC